MNSLGSLFTEYVFNSESDVVKRHIQNYCFFCVWSSQKWKEPWQTSVCMEAPVSRGNICPLMKTERGIIHLTFQGTRVLPKPFGFDLFTADLASQDLPCNTAWNSERSQTSCRALWQQILEPMKSWKEE